LNPTTSRSIEQTELTQQAQIALPISELLSCSAKIKYIPKPESFIANLADSIGKRASHNINFFADLVGIWSGCIRRLLLWNTKLRLEVLCQLCSRLNVSPLDLLLDRGNTAAFQDRHLLLERDTPVVKEVTPWEEVEGRLWLSLKESPPPSMEAVARRMGYHPPKIKSHYPGLCKQIIDRYWEHQKDKRPPQKKIISALKAALKEEPPPSLQRVFRRLGCKDTGYYYYVNYEDLCLAVAKRYKSYRNKSFDKGKDQRRLKAALNEEPPPSFSEVARRLDHERDFVRRKFPELSKMIASRYLHYTKVLRKEKAERLRREIRKAIPQLSASGLNASEARVKALVKQTLPNLGRDSLFKQALREVKAELGIA
jgi:AcrR family transcriptional regulator